MNSAVRTPDNRRGYSLIELMVVLVILGVGILPIVYVQSRSRQVVAESGRRTDALSVAQRVMETAKNQGYNKVALTDTGADGVYEWSQSVETVSTGLQRITVSVNWTDRGRVSHVTVIDMLSMR